MTIVVQKRRDSSVEYSIPAGGSILWYGIASQVPANWSIVSACYDVFVRGADQGQASNTPASSLTHNHANPAATSIDPNHVHTVGGGGTSAANASETFYSYGAYDTAAPNHNHSIPVGSSAAGGGHSHTLSNTNNNTIYPPYVRMYWIKASIETPAPIGSIIMLDAPISTKPSGFELCNGQNGTPDLRDKFVYGASQDAHLGAIGGADTHAHTNSNTGNAGSHVHSIGLQLGNSGGGDSGSGYAGTQVAAPHDHQSDSTAPTDPDHSHSVSNSDAGSSIPAYLKLYFLMRLV